MPSSRALALPTTAQADLPFAAESIRRTRRPFVFWLLFGATLLFYVLSHQRTNDSDTTRPTRKLLESAECTSHPEWIKKGGVVLYFIGTCYMFVGMYIICNEYLVKSLYKISRQLKLSEDVAGATFMAAGSSAPELFTSLVALTNDQASTEIEVGTIVGSAVFNILAIIGVIAIFSGRTLNLDYRPLVRDCLFYATAIIGVVAVFYDGKIYWWEGLIFVMLYGVYILAMKFNKTILNLFPEPTTNYERFIASDLNLVSYPLGHVETSSSDEEIYHIREVNSNEAPLLPKTNGDTLNMSKTTTEQQGQNGKANSDSVVECTQTREGDKSPFSVPEGKLDRLYWMVLLPWRLLFHYTIPDCTKEHRQNWYMATFIISILWIGVISWFMVEWAADIGCALGIPSEVTGETLLAIGLSIPKASSSISIARAGEGDVAVANAVGSNVFDIWIGLGLPWLVVIPFRGETSPHGMYVVADKGELILSLAILFGVLLVYLVSVISSGWKIDKRHGHVFIFLCLVYTLYDLVVKWALAFQPENE